MPIYRLDDNSFAFPPAEEATEDNDWILAIGGDYHPKRLIEAYAQGIFPWPIQEGMPITWFSPDPRFVLKAADLHIPKSLLRTLKKDLFEYRVNTAFEDVMRACASTPRPNQPGTWITNDLIKGYCELHRLGFAHSFEAWQNGLLVGGFYGVALGNCFFGESMFARVPDASKCTFATFARYLFDKGLPWIDCQTYTDHLARFGAKEIPRANYLKMLKEALNRS
jgi:leucyl/phenylalanyl-tRNA--protein transferase